MNQLAYLDPASASLIAATAAGGLAGAGVAAKSMWHRRTARFRKDDPAETTIDLTDAPEVEAQTDLEPEFEDSLAPVDPVSSNDH